ncbi:hypothetical protein HPP92_018953 [Vanilla planifolia]|uniref:Tunicamycin induced 1 n=1 Tax=Vanilla planifolia TaxID=51239 RepID=A0A835Q836_VANPL|nr:hypothetical protein HPP92_019511 [Vanilla planifolia]KAG0464789.1 hypothetical protein HPP92_018953 [Vanilla planifolia]
MAIRPRFLAGFLFFFLIGDAAHALFSSETMAPPVPKAISDLKDSTLKGLGFQSVEGLQVSGFDVRDALVGQSVAYEFEIEVDKKVIPIILLEDVSRWDVVDLPIFRPTAAEVGEEEKALVESGRREDRMAAPALPPFQLAGPIELWIQDADDMRLALPNDVEAGTLRKVVLSDGAAVTVNGARSVNLRRPLELPLPLNRTNQANGLPIASGLLHIAEALRAAARSSDLPLLSLGIVGPSSLTSSTSASPNNKLKLKRLSPGLVQLSSREVPPVTESGFDLSQDRKLWPLTSLNGSDSNLRGFEELLASILGKKAYENGQFRLVKAEVSAHTYIKMAFSVEKAISDGELDFSYFPSWMTRPERVKAHFEVLGRLDDGGKVVPVKIQELQPFQVVDSMMESVQTANASMAEQPIIYPPQSYFTL